MPVSISLTLFYDKNFVRYKSRIRRFLLTVVFVVISSEKSRDEMHMVHGSLHYMFDAVMPFVQVTLVNV